VRNVVVVLLVVLPQRLKHVLARRVLGWDLHPTSYIGRSLVRVNKVTMGPGASIGPFNVLRDLEELRMDEGAQIGSRNWIIGVPLESVIYPKNKNRQPSLLMGPYAMITTGHDIDCADRVELEDHAVIAGFRSAILTHSLNFVTDKFVTGPVVLHEYSVLLSGCTMMTSTNIPARSIVSAGSVVTTRLKAEQTMYRGNPAEAVRDLPDNLRFYERVGQQSQLAAEIRRWGGVAE